MSFSIQVTRTTNSNLPNIDFDNLKFGKIMSDHMFVVDYADGEWRDARIEPVKPLAIHPANSALHYGQSIFEGMKASIDNHGTPLLFRPVEHAKRLNRSAERICMPAIPEDLFLEALHALLDLDKAWIPTNPGSALYIRPFMFATDEFLGVAVSKSYKFIILTSPVPPFYASPVKLWASQEFVRAAHGGVGEAKVAGNYAAALYPGRLAKQKGFDQVMWLDAKEFRYVQEVGTMNIFFVIGDEVLTPATDGAILKGITRDTFIHLLAEQGKKVVERPIDIQEVVHAYDNGQLNEVFGAGTAAVSINVSHIGYGDRILEIPEEKWGIAKMLRDQINGLRNGSLPDNRGWIVPVQSTVTA